MGMGWNGGMGWMGIPRMGMGMGQIDGVGDIRQVKHDEHIGRASQNVTLREYLYKLCSNIALKSAVR